MSPLVVVPRWRPLHLEAYRRYTRALLRRYFKLSLSIGRLPSVLGSAAFRTRATRYRLQSFEDVVIFVHDVEQCLQQLERAELEMLAAIVLQEYTREEAAACFGISMAQTERRYTAALDALSQVLLERELLPAVWQEAGSEPGDGTELVAESRQLPPRKPAACVRMPETGVQRRGVAGASVMMRPGAGGRESHISRRRGDVGHHAEEAG